MQLNWFRKEAIYYLWLGFFIYNKKNKAIKWHKKEEMISSEYKGRSGYVHKIQILVSRRHIALCGLI